MTIGIDHRGKKSTGNEDDVPRQFPMVKPTAYQPPKMDLYQQVVDHDNKACFLVSSGVMLGLGTAHKDRGQNQGRI